MEAQEADPLPNRIAEGLDRQVGVDSYPFLGVQILGRHAQHVSHRGQEYEWRRVHPLDNPAMHSQPEDPRGAGPVPATRPAKFHGPQKAWNSNARHGKGRLGLGRK